MAGIALDPTTHRNLLSLRNREQAIEKELSKAESLGLPGMEEHRAAFEEAKRIRKLLLENYAPGSVSLEE